MQARSFVTRQRRAATAGLSLALFLALLSAAGAQQPSAPGAGEAQQQSSSAEGTAAERESWRREMQTLPRPATGCYTATYPVRAWREVPCKTPPTKLFLPRTRGTTELDTVGGGGTDFLASVTGAITQAEGSFDSVANVTATPAYSLQLNTDFFPTSTCSASPNTSGCRGWEQFVYHSSGVGVMQYWLINYGPTNTTCPTPRSAHCDGSHVFTDGWCPITLGSSANPVYCVVNAASGVPATAEPATSLGQLSVRGVAAGVNGATTDSMTVSVGNSVFSANGDNYFSDLGSNWKDAEFNVFGDCCNEQAVFNSNASAVVRVAVDSGVRTGPGCLMGTFTAESSNLTLQNTPPSASPGSLPALVFAENNPASAGGAADCSDAVSLGDTHLTTFSGLHYDFQASGDFLLAEAGQEFAVQTRQASGAPMWPNAAVNKAVATRMGKTTVALCLAPTRVLIDGTPRRLGSRQSIDLPDGVTLSRAGDVFFIQRINGDSVHARLNHGAQPQFDWLDVSVYLGDRGLIPKVRGLLGNPDGDPNLIGVADGTILKEPVSFETLYHRYGDSWRVPIRDSLLCRDREVKSGNPGKPFFAGDLTEAQQARARAICEKAGVKQEAALADCVLDVTVLGARGAALGLARAPIPKVVWQAGAR